MCRKDCSVVTLLGFLKYKRQWWVLYNSVSIRLSESHDMRKKKSKKVANGHTSLSRTYTTNSRRIQSEAIDESRKIRAETDPTPALSEAAQPRCPVVASAPLPPTQQPGAVPQLSQPAWAECCRAMRLMERLPATPLNSLLNHVRDRWWQSNSFPQDAVQLW